MDDILIFSKSLAQHIALFNEVMRKLREANLSLQIEKCQLLEREVYYLGHIISKEGIGPNPEKIKAMKYFPTPRNVKNVRQFLGASSFHRKFIKNYAKVSKPLTLLLDTVVIKEFKIYKKQFVVFAIKQSIATF